VNVFKKAGVAFDRLEDFLVYLAAAAALALVLMDCAEIFLRTLFGRSIRAAVEIEEYLQLFIVFMSAAYIQRLGGHVKLELVLGSLSSRNRALVSAVTTFLGGVFLLILSGYGTATAVEMAVRGVYRITPLEFPKAPLISAVALGLFLLAIRFLRNAYEYASEYRSQRRRTGIGKKDGHVIHQS